MYELKKGVLVAAQYGRWYSRFVMDTAKGLTPDACRDLALFVAGQMFPALGLKVQYHYCFSGGVVAFFIDIFIT